jgi:hypothetical protein
MFNCADGFVCAAAYFKNSMLTISIPDSISTDI